jgi:hypothetical protein
MLLFFFFFIAIVSGIYVYKILWDFTASIVKKIKTKWLRITIQILLNTIFFVLVAWLLFSALLMILAFNTGKSKK